MSCGGIVFGRSSQVRTRWMLLLRRPPRFSYSLGAPGGVRSPPRPVLDSRPFPSTEPDATRSRSL